MVEHVEPIADRVVATPLPRAPSGGRWVARATAWALDETLLFPVVAIYVISLALSLPRELFSDGWLAILGGHEVVHHGLPSHDALTIWTHGQQWVDQQWLGQLFFYGLYAAGGIKLALLGHVAAAGSAFTLAIVFARWRGASMRSVCWLSLPAMFLLIWGSWNVRAQSLAFVLFVAVVWLLIRDARAPSRGVLFVFPLLVLWANIHGTAITGALLVVLAGLTFAFERRRQPLRRWAPRATLLCLAPVACLLASPYALSLPGYYHRMLANPGFRDYIVEWRPTAPDFQTAPFFALAFLAVWLIGRQGSRLLRIEKIFIGLTIVMGLQSLRGVVWFAVIVLMLVPTALDGALKANTSAMRFGLLNRALVAVSITGIVASLGGVAAKPSSWFEHAYPQAALAAVTKAEKANPQVRVFADEQYSDWLLLRRPELRGRVAYDARFELFSGDQLRKLVDVRRQVDGWQKVVAPYGLFVLKKSAEGKLAAGLLRFPGARALYRGHGLIVIARPAGGSVAR
jgi:hypothetical protein